MESEYVAMSSACKDLFPIMDLVKEIGPVFDLPVNNKSRFHIRIHEDNVGALLLGQLEQGKCLLAQNIMQSSIIGFENK